MSGNGYPPLPLSQVQTRRDIRLLQLSPGKWDTPLHANLRVVSLEEEPDFEALSYTWGKDTLGHSIEVNGRYRLGLTDNLFTCLRRFRQGKQKSQLWIDALCIDQTDDNEKSSQVSLMGSIYGAAKSVLVWLGDAESTLSEDLDLVGRLSSAAILDDIRDMRKGIFGEFYTTKLPLSMVFLRHKLHVLGKAITNTQPQWTERAWVRQEYLLSRRMYLCFGNMRLPEERLRVADFKFSQVRTQARKAALTTPEVQWFDALDILDSALIGLRINKGVGQDTRDLCTFLRSNERFGDATDPRDHIYSLSGLVKEGLLIETDYATASYAEVFAQATYASIAQRHDFAILAQGVAPGRMARKPLPSWVVDFSMKKPFTEHSTAFNDHGVDPLAKGTRPAAEDSFRADRRKSTIAHMDPATNILTVSGTDKGYVAAVNPNVSTYTDPSEYASDDNVEVAVITQVRAFLIDTLTSGITFQSPSDFPRTRPKLQELLVLEGTDFKYGRKDVDASHGLLIAFDRYAAVMKDPKPSRLNDHFSTEAGRFRLMDTFKYATWAGDPHMRVLHSSYPVGTITVFLTGNADIGFAPNGIEVGDRIVFVRGSRLPFVLRPCAENWTFHGFAYIYCEEVDRVPDRPLWMDEDPEAAYKEFRIC